MLELISCIIFCITPDCMALRWESNRPPDAAYTYIVANNPDGSIAWSTKKQPGAESHFPGDGVWDIYVGHVDSNLVPLNKMQHIEWTLNPERFLDDTNGPPSRWVGRTMCAVN